MKNKLLKISIFFIIFFYVLSAQNIVKAGLFDDLVGQGNSFIDKGKEQAGSINMDESINQITGIASILTGIGVAVMMGVTAYMGIKYLTAGPEAKAKLKTQLIGIIVSGVVIFGAVQIWSLVINIAKNF